MSDREARDKILRLLRTKRKTPVPPVRHLVGGLEGRGVTDSPYGPSLEVPDSVRDSIRDLRRYYKRLHDQIQDIPTDSNGKRTALRALRAFDSGLKHFYQGLTVGSPEFASDELHEAQAYLKDAHSGLLRARKQLR